MSNAFPVPLPNRLSGALPSLLSSLLGASRKRPIELLSNVSPSPRGTGSHRLCRSSVDAGGAAGGFSLLRQETLELEAAAGGAFFSSLPRHLLSFVVPKACLRSTSSSFLRAISAILSFSAFSLLRMNLKQTTKILETREDENEFYVVSRLMVTHFKKTVGYYTGYNTLLPYRCLFLQRKSRSIPVFTNKLIQPSYSA